MSKKVLIVGAGNVCKTTISELLSKEGISESDVIYAEDLVGAEKLVAQRNKEALNRLSIEELTEPLINPSSCYRDEQKQNSQQGWKNRSKYHR